MINFTAMQPSLYQPDSAGFKDSVHSMFSSIAHSYDFLNHLFSFNIDKYWRVVTVHELRDRLVMQDAHEAIHILDLATGTGDLAFEICRQTGVTVTGVDLAQEMIDVARKKLLKKPVLQLRLQFITGDAEKLSFPDNCFDGVTIGFGIRNFPGLNRCFAEIMRVLKPGAPLVIIEFSQPKTGIVRAVMTVFNRLLFPVIGRLLSGHRTAYSYLPVSVACFPYGQVLADKLSDAGFLNVRFKQLSFGIVTVYSCSARD